MLNPLLLHSVSYAGLWGQAFLTVGEFIEKAADLGYDGVMLMAKRPHLSVLEFSLDECRRLREKLEDRNLQTVCIAGYTNFTADLEHADIPHREFQIQHVTELARLAHGLGGNLVRIFTGYENGAAPISAQWKILVESLRECARRAADFDVTIGLQNHHDLAVGYEQMHDLICAVGEPNCRAMFDAWAPFLHGSDLVEAAKQMGSMTVHTTIADYRFRPRYHYDPALINYVPATPSLQAVPMGDGEIDYSSFLLALRQAGFSGSIGYEMCSPLLGGGSVENLDAYARRFVAYMRALLPAEVPSSLSGCPVA